MTDKEEALKVKQKYEEELLKTKGVVGVGVNGSVIIYVDQLTPQLAQFLPRKLDDIPVRIVETGKIVPLSIPLAKAIYASRTERIRPAPGGVSIGSTHVTAGTLGCLAKDKRTRQILGLSNNHVCGPLWGTNRVAEPGTTPVLQPGPADGARDPTDRLGVLDRIMPVDPSPTKNLIDAAAFSSDYLSESILEVGKPSQTVDPKVGMNLKKSGARSGLTCSKILDSDATLIVDGWGEAVFSDIVVGSPAFGIPGDSGSWVGNENDETIGLLFAGSTEITLVCKATHIESLLDLEIIPPIGYLPWYQMLGAWSGILSVGQITVSALRARRKGYVV